MKKCLKLKEFIIYILIFFGYYKTLFYEANVILQYIQYILILISIIYVITLIAYRKSIVTPNSVIILLFLFLVISIISASWTSSTVYVYKKIKEIIVIAFYCLIFYIIGYDIDTLTFLKISSKLNLLAIILYSVINIESIINGFDLRIGNVVGDNPIWICRLCSSTILAMAILDIYQKNIFIFFRSIQYLFILFIAFRTGSKGPWFALIASIFILGCDRFLPKMKRKKIFNKFLGLAVCAAIVITLYFEKVSLFLHSRFASSFANIKGYRMHMYLSTMDAILKNPVKGYGLASWPIFYGMEDSIGYPHNILLECWFESGLFSLIIFIILVLLLFCKAKKSYCLEYRILFPFFVFDLISSMFSGSLFGGNRGVFIFIVLLAINCSKEKKIRRRVYEGNICLL